jgi:hypothetical protein
MSTPVHHTTYFLYQDTSSEKSLQIFDPPRHAEVFYLLALNPSLEPASPQSHGLNAIAASR